MTGNIGFTPYAHQHLLGPLGHVVQSERTDPHVWVMGGWEGKKRLRKEVKTTLLLVFIDYVAEEHMTHLWTVRDGRRHLVHRRK
jgi:hypothetical protein